jgi:GT2 family glycosyltransferase
MIIHYISPYSVTKDIGGEYNARISELPEDCWVCLLDHDAMFLHPDSKKQIYEIVSKGEYQVYGVVTNRLASKHQLYFGHFSENTNIADHFNIASDLHETYYGKVVRTKKDIAGLCMLFRKSTWLMVGGFKLNSISLDRDFCDDVKSRGGRLGIMQGVYMFHLYRLGKEDPTRSISHLLKDR